MTKPSRERLQEALLDPPGVFASPDEVVTLAELSREQKIRILKAWEYDAAEAEVATEEGMPGEAEGLLRLILLALHRVSSGVDASRTAPSKQHGLL